MDPITDAVTRQYEVFPYPPLESTGKWDAVIEGGDPSIFSPLLWPEGQPRPDLRILVAGCGTMQAARYALHNPSCSVLGIDLSEAAIAAHERLKAERDLANLEVRRLDLRDTACLGLQFDFIASTGVLHHLQQPVEGLRALANILDPRGAMIVMFYGAAARAGVYMLQDAFRRLGLAADQEGINFARGVLAALPKHHYFKWYESKAPDLKSDAGLVDTLFHAQDHAYSVPQLLQVIADAGLQFQSWEENYFYFPEGNILAGTPLWKKLKAIAERDQWAVIENMTLAIGRHSCIVSRPEREFSAISFAGSRYLSYFPKPVFGIKFLDEGNSQPRRFRRGGLEFQMSELESTMFAKCDGKHTIAQLQTSLSSTMSTSHAEFARFFFERMWKLGHLWMLSAPL